MKALLLDMYGVIIKESKGNFIPYTFSHFPQSEHDRLKKQFKVDNLFTKAGNGDIDSEEFLSMLGFSDPEFHMRDYIENHLSVDEGFYAFAQQFQSKYRFALLSNDVAQWSRYITQYYGLDKYLPQKIVSGEVRCRKPDPGIFDIALARLNISAGECIFVDNSVENLAAAERAGMDTILFNRDKLDYDGKTVNSFVELAGLL